MTQHYLALNEAAIYLRDAGDKPRLILMSPEQFAELHAEIGEPALNVTGPNKLFGATIELVRGWPYPPMMGTGEAYQDFLDRRASFQPLTESAAEIIAAAFKRVSGRQ
jgi:hypothetical protein